MNSAGVRATLGPSGWLVPPIGAFADRLEASDFQIGDRNLHKDWSNLVHQYAGDAAKIAIDTTKTCADWLAENPGSSLPIGRLPTDKMLRLRFRYSEDTSSAATYGATTLIATASASGSASQVVTVASTVAPALTALVVTVNGAPLVPTSGFTLATNDVTIVAAHPAGAVIKIYLVARGNYLISSFGTSATDFTATATQDMTAWRNIVIQVGYTQSWINAIEAVSQGRALTQFANAASFGYTLSSATSAGVSTNQITGAMQVNNATPAVGSARQAYATPGVSSFVLVPQFLTDGSTNPTTGTIEATKNIWGGFPVTSLVGTWNKADTRSIRFRFSAFCPSVEQEAVLWLFAVQRDVIPKRRPALIITLDDVIRSQYDNRAEFSSRKLPVCHAITYSGIFGAPSRAAETGAAQSNSNALNYSAAQMIQMYNETFVDNDGVTRRSVRYITHGSHATNGWCDFTRAQIEAQITILWDFFAANNLGSRGNQFVVYPQNCWHSFCTTGERIIDVVRGLGCTVGRSAEVLAANLPQTQPAGSQTLHGIRHINCLAAVADENLIDATDAQAAVDLMTISGMDVCLTYHGIVAAGPVAGESLLSDVQGHCDVYAAARNAGNIRVPDAIEYGAEIGLLPAVATEGYNHGDINTPSLVGPGATLGPSGWLVNEL